jgi:type IV pilus assembly protein PilX
MHEKQKKLFATSGLDPQRGVSLIIVLILLTIVSLLGVAGIQVSTMSERSARNDRDQQMAWQAAEAALLDAELDIYDPAVSTRQAIFSSKDESAFVAGCGNATSGNSKGLCSFVNIPGAKPAWLAVDFTATGNAAATVQYGDFTGREFQSTGSAAGAGIQSALPPRYVIEPVVDESGIGDSRDKSLVNKNYLYRVTSIGYGPRADIQTVLQMSFRTPTPR